MKKSLLFIFAFAIITINAKSQSIDNSFFQKVSYVGAFDGVNDWTAGWTEWPATGFGPRIFSSQRFL